MTGGGLLALIAYGSQNVILSGTPQMTYFYKTFRRYTHFATENVTTAMDGPNELPFDRPIELRAKIQRVGDLLCDLYFTFTIPDIYSKFISPGSRQYEFKWVRYLGAAIIQKAAFFVGGQKIQEFDGTYLLAKAMSDLTTDEFEKWRILIGDTDELNDPSKGVYAGGPTASAYPSVFQNPSNNINNQANRPSIFGQEIHVPLSFWFSEAFSNALPLVGLQFHECEVRITLNPIERLYTYLDLNGNRVAPNYQVSSPPANSYLNIPTYGQNTDLNAPISAFLADWGVTRPPLDQFYINPRLQATYVYLPTDEQRIFAISPLSYVVTQVTPQVFTGLTVRKTLDIEIHNPLTRLFFLPKRSDSSARNDFSNFTNWSTNPTPPYNPTPTTTDLTNPLYSQALASGILASGLIVPNGQISIIRALRVLCDGNEIQQEKTADYFTKITPWKYMKGQTKTLFPVYSFSLHSPGVQPSGSINASRIRNFQVEVDVFDLPPNTTYTYDLTIYVENINFFEVASGMGGVKYAI